MQWIFREKPMHNLSIASGKRMKIYFIVRQRTHMCRMPLHNCIGISWTATKLNKRYTQFLIWCVSWCKIYAGSLEPAATSFISPSACIHFEYFAWQDQIGTRNYTSTRDAKSVELANGMEDERRQPTIRWLDTFHWNSKIPFRFEFEMRKKAELFFGCCLVLHGIL